MKENMMYRLHAMTVNNDHLMTRKTTRLKARIAALWSRWFGLNLYFSDGSIEFHPPSNIAFVYITKE